MAQSPAQRPRHAQHFRIRLAIGFCRCSRSDRRTTVRSSSRNAHRSLPPETRIDLCRVKILTLYTNSVAQGQSSYRRDLSERPGHSRDQDANVVFVRSGELWRHGDRTASGCVGHSFQPQGVLVTHTLNGPGPYMMRIRGLGVTAPYVGLLIVRLLFVLLLPLMPETLPVRPLHDDASESVNSSSDEADVKPAAFASRFLAAPIALLQPFRVLVPAKVDGRRSYQLPLIAASYALLMIVPGLVRQPSYRAGPSRRADSEPEADQCPSFAGSCQNPLRSRHLRLGSG
jgi:hypothetical protein